MKLKEGLLSLQLEIFALLLMNSTIHTNSIHFFVKEITINIDEIMTHSKLLHQSEEHLCFWRLFNLTIESVKMYLRRL